MKKCFSIYNVFLNAIKKHTIVSISIYQSRIKFKIFDTISLIVLFQLFQGYIAEIYYNLILS